MIFISTILIFFFTLNIFLKMKNKKKLKLKNFNYFCLKVPLYKIIFDIILILVFIFMYLLFFKFLRVFKETDYIDLLALKKKIDLLLLIFDNKMLILIIFIILYLLLKFIRNYIIFWLKIIFFELNYYLQSHSNFYCKIYTCIYWQYDLWYWLTSGRRKYKYKKQILNIIYYFFRYIGFLILFLCFIFDIIFNNFFLKNFSTFLPLFSLYQTLYYINNFFSRKINLDNEFYIYSSLYIEYLFNKKLYLEYKNSKQKISFSAYINISKNILKESIPKIDNKTIEDNNNYILNLLQ